METANWSIPIEPLELAFPFLLGLRWPGRQAGIGRGEKHTQTLHVHIYIYIYLFIRFFTISVFRQFSFEMLDLNRHIDI